MLGWYTQWAWKHSKWRKWISPSRNAPLQGPGYLSLRVRACSPCFLLGQDLDLCFLFSEFRTHLQHSFYGSLKSEEVSLASCLIRPNWVIAFPELVLRPGLIHIGLDSKSQGSAVTLRPFRPHLRAKGGSSPSITGAVWARLGQNCNNHQVKGKWMSGRPPWRPLD